MRQATNRQVPSPPAMSADFAQALPFILCNTFHMIILKLYFDFNSIIWILPRSRRREDREPTGRTAMRIGLLCAAVSLCALVGTPAAAQVQERTIRWGHLNNTDHPVSAGVQKFAEVLAAKSGGKLKIREFAASQLGNELQQQSALRGGTQEMFSASTTSLAAVVKDFGLFDFPFIVASDAQADALGTGAYAKAMMETLPEKDLVALGYWGLGFR